MKRRTKSKFFIIGLILFLIGGFGYYFLMLCTRTNGCADIFMETPALYALLPFVFVFLMIIGALVFIAHFKSWLVVEK